MFQKVMTFLGLADEEQPRREEELIDEQQQQQGQQESVVPLKRQGTVVSLHTQKQVRVYLAEPETYDDAQGIADHLRNRRPVVVNLHKAPHDVAKRVIDFISGCTYALGGTLQKLGHNIFLCAPENIDVQGSISDLLEDGSLSSMNNPR
ncbi:cell division protein SepF [Tumebacillus permanentifrigoris]|uniref:Cell division protein SepF n=1 Tax=Tumebacillus permanentifrigoris TaxID=378543 RepID=A0A316D4I6_9BACL|nr:cell division protein SepF [Tumebacillus permanentifrigoris]PWK04952.1 cell division inhibitor SepF [Tumebacillus permanentifrigoris]